MHLIVKQERFINTGFMSSAISLRRASMWKLVHRGSALCDIAGGEFWCGTCKKCARGGFSVICFPSWLRNDLTIHIVSYFETWANWRTLQGDDVRGANCTLRLNIDNSAEEIRRLSRLKSFVDDRWDFIRCWILSQWRVLRRGVLWWNLEI